MTRPARFRNGVLWLVAAPSLAASQHAGLFAVWTPAGGLAAVEPDALPLTASALETARAYRAPAGDAPRGCEPPGMPAMLDTALAVGFADRGDRIAVRYEEWNGERTVYLRPGGGPPVQDPSPAGVSFGRWEGATLAIFTLYIDYPYFDARGTPQSAGVTVLERYTPSADGTRLDWEVTITDAATFTEPVVRRGHMTSAPGRTIEPVESDCAPVSTR